MESHVKAVGIIHIAFSVLGILIALILFSVLNLVARMPEVEEEAVKILQTIGMVIPWFVIVCSAPGIAGGIGLLKYQAWGRILVLILSFLSLLNFPIGTAVGIYSIWVLFDKRTEKLFAKSKK
jgi:Na+-driven multidrug efflux pump